MGFDYNRKKSKMASFSPLVFLVLGVSFFLEWWYFSAQRNAHFELESNMEIEHEQLLVLLSQNSTKFFIVTGIIFAIGAIWFIASKISQSNFKKEQERFYQESMQSAGNSY